MERYFALKISLIFRRPKNSVLKVSLTFRELQPLVSDKRVSCKKKIAPVKLTLSGSDFFFDQPQSGEGRFIPPLPKM